MNINSTKGKLLAHAFSAAPSAVVFGFCLVRTTRHFDRFYLAVMVLFGASLIADLLWTRREVRRLAASETAKKAAAKKTVVRAPKAKTAKKTARVKRTAKKAAAKQGAPVPVQPAEAAVQDPTPA